jgi:FkbM family methyltransferase
MSFIVFKLLKDLRLPKPQGIVHVGANDGSREFEFYRSIGAKTVLYIEPIPQVFEKLKTRVSHSPNHHPLMYLCSDVNGEEVIFNIASNQGESSSMLPMGKHSIFHPSIKYVDSIPMKTRTLDSILAEEFAEAKFDLLMLDTQGTELKVLQGAHQFLKKIRYIYTEISEEPLYEGSCVHQDITAFLKLYGFKLKYMMITCYIWGEALYVRDVEVPEPPTEQNLCLNKPAQQSSLSPWSKLHDARGAVNGVKTGLYGFHTNFEKDPWWQVDLESIYSLQEIRLYNRLDAATERVETLRVLLSLDCKNWHLAYVNDEDYVFGGIDGNPLIISLEAVKTRYIRLQLNETNYLHIDEVEAYGFPIS